MNKTIVCVTLFSFYIAVYFFTRVNQECVTSSLKSTRHTSQLDTTYSKLTLNRKYCQASSEGYAEKHQYRLQKSAISFILQAKK